MAKKLILIDGHALAYRAFFALPVDGFSTSRGELTNAVYGFTMMLLHSLQVEKPDYIAVTFDAPAATFRHEEFEEYKAHRPPMREEMRSQMDRIREVVRVLNIPIFELAGYEADDLIGSLARQASGREVETVIVTGDNDTLQLVSPLVEVITPGGYSQRFSDAKVYDEQAVREKYGIPNDKPVVTVFVPKVRDMGAVSMDNIRNVLRKDGCYIITKTRIKDPTPKRYQGDKHFHTSYYHPATPLELMAVSDIMVNFDSTAVKEAILMDTPVINFPVKTHVKPLHFLYDGVCAVNMRKPFDYGVFDGHIKRMLEGSFEKAFKAIKEQSLFTGNVAEKIVNFIEGKK